MKYLIYVLSLFSLFICITYADSNIEITNKIISFNNISGYNLQSFTVVKDKLVVVLVAYDNDKAILKIFDLNNYKEIKSINISSVGHANGITYNSKNNKIYIIGAHNTNIVYEYDGTTYDFIKQFTIDIPARSITYVEEQDIYLVRNFMTGYKLDNEFNLISKIPFIIGLNPNTDMAKQDWTYYDNYLYYVNWSWIRYGGDGSNIIYIYNLNGKSIDTKYTSNDIGELEDIAFYNNRIILGFNGYDDKVNFYLEDLFEIQEEIIIDSEEIVDTEDDEDTKNNYYLYLLIFPILIILISILTINKKRKLN